MAKFEIAEKITGRNEGGYANNPADNGGETYAGIARKFWPAWGGWVIIDKIKEVYGKNANTINLWAGKDKALQAQISLFYKQNFWDANKLSLFNDQSLANSVYDFGVNSGIKKAAKSLQELLGVTVDGMIGAKTIEAVNHADAKAIHTAYNAKRKSFYETLAANPSQHQFLKSWLSRLKPYETV